MAQARELATQLNRGYEIVQVLALQALLAECADQSPDALLTEALSRAESGGLVRVLADTLPVLVDLVRRNMQGTPPRIVTRAFVDRRDTNRAGFTFGTACVVGKSAFRQASHPPSRTAAALCPAQRSIHHGRAA